jgi:hypothetical protein
MSAPRLLDRDPLTRTSRWFWYDEETGDFRIETRQDVSELVAANKDEYNATDERARFNAHGKESPMGARMASIPLQVWGQLVAQGIVDWNYQILDQKRYKAWLNDSENVHFRTRPGRI